MSENLFDPDSPISRDDELINRIIRNQVTHDDDELTQALADWSQEHKIKIDDNESRINEIMANMNRPPGISSNLLFIVFVIICVVCLIALSWLLIQIR